MYPSITCDPTCKTNKSSELLAASLLYRGWHPHSSFLEREKIPQTQIMPVASCFLHCRQQTPTPGSSGGNCQSTAQSCRALAEAVTAGVWKLLLQGPHGKSAQQSSGRLLLIPHGAASSPRDQHFPIAPGAGQCHSVPLPACHSKAGAEPPLLSSDPKVHKEIQRFGMTVDAAEEGGRGDMEGGRGEVPGCVI